MWGVALDAWVSRALFLLPLLCVGYDIFREVGEGIVQGKLLDENFLMSVASIGAFAMGECAEGVAVLTFYQIGELFEGYADRKSRRNIVSLMKIRPERATVERGDQTGTCEPSQVEVGSVIVVNPGERIPLDGVVVSGTSTLHTAALTGESLPRR
ncbi:MAG: heavy metal translocating P-type ATPase, partial [Kiritimatiellae bacterium]|nr:heavy metal translocating P-type ATPase [Kiritimatiellia bacterium]